MIKMKSKSKGIKSIGGIKDKEKIESMIQKRKSINKEKREITRSISNKVWLIQ